MIDSLTLTFHWWSDGEGWQVGHLRCDCWQGAMYTVMLSLETVSCLKTVLRQFFGVLVLVLRVAVLLTTLDVHGIVNVK